MSVVVVVPLEPRGLGYTAPTPSSECGGRVKYMEHRISLPHNTDFLVAVYYREPVPESIERNNQRYRRYDNARVGQRAKLAICARIAESLALANGVVIFPM